jgi:hypothetical protein
MWAEGASEGKEKAVQNSLDTKREQFCFLWGRAKCKNNAQQTQSHMRNLLWANETSRPFVGAMSIFQCTKCGCAENTALSFGYHGGIFDPQEAKNKGLDPDGRYCSVCWDGEWHGKFPRKFYPLGTMQTDRYGNLGERGKQ